VKLRESCWTEADGRVAACPDGLMVERIASNRKPAVTYRARKFRSVKDGTVRIVDNLIVKRYGTGRPIFSD
jgi:hypothetical protein